MATPIGTNVVTSIARRYIMPEVVDNIYGSNVLFYRLNKAKKKLVQGGTQIEVPLMYSVLGTGGPYQGYDVLDVVPSDTIKNAAFDWKQYYVNVTVDGLTLIKTDSPEAIANFIKLYFEQATMQMADNLGTGLFTDTTSNTKAIDGLKGAVDDATVATTYGGLSRSTNTWWKSRADTSTATLTLASLQSMYGGVSSGGRKPSLIISGQDQYNRFWALNQTLQRYPAGAGDEQLAQAGFSNLLFNGTPWVVDSHTNAGINSTNTSIYFLNEDYINFAVSPRADFYLEDFQAPVNQDAMVAKLLWAGNVVFSNCARQGVMTDVGA